MRKTSKRKTAKKKPGPRAGLLVSGTKDTNPKDAIGLTKSPISTVSGAVIMEMGLGMLEGALKYGRHNYRVAGVRSSVYYDAAIRHLFAWWEGEDIDPESGLHHVTKALSCLSVIRDAQLQGKEFDDRPPKTRFKMVSRMNGLAKDILARYPDPVAPFTAKPRKAA